MHSVRKFWKTRRSAIAVTAAIALVPLVLLVGIAVDVTFLSQDRLQTTFASHAASIAGVRTAASTYAIEEADNITNGVTESATLAAQQAINSADVTGNLWFDADLGAYSIGSNQSRSTLAKFDGSTDGTVNTASPPNFSAQVTANSTYPPIFNGLFGRTSTWQYTDSGTATSQFAYAEILLMLDTSNSMLIGADPSDILTMEGNSVCPKTGYLTVASGLTTVNQAPTWYGFQTNDNDQVYFNNATDVPNYNNPSNGVSDTSGTCKNGYGPGASLTFSGQTEAANQPINNCALACHSTTAKYTDGYYSDLYGAARREKVDLRIDVVLKATEQVIQDMQGSEAVANQLTVGVYQFNSDVLPIVTGANYGQTNGDATPEATANLTTALSEVQAVDYNKTPSETAIPVLVNNTTTLNMSANPPTAALVGNTNFSLSLADLLKGNATGGASDAISPAGSGTTPGTPEKFMFIVTDGMQDSAPANGGGENGVRVIGEMTNIAAEQTAAKLKLAQQLATCSTLKYTDGFTVYVLYVTYYPLASQIAYYNYLEKPDAAVDNDFPQYSGYNGTPQLLSEVPSESAPNKFEDAPDGQALAACASSKSDFYQASDSVGIQTALNSMLKSALASTIRLTN